MKVRKQGAGVQEEIQLQMTPMIDIVFQLLVFFIMLFKIVLPEGDFNLKMPAGAPREGAPDPDQLPPMKLHLFSHPSGYLRGIQLNEKSFASNLPIVEATDKNPYGENPQIDNAFLALRLHLMGVVGTDRGPNTRQATAEVEIDPDPNLKYQHIIQAITAISGFKDESKKTVKLIEKIKFSKRRPTS